MSYTPKHKYTPDELFRCQIQDLLVDIRCGYESGEHGDYTMKCEQDVIRLLFSSNPKMDTYGYYD